MKTIRAIMGLVLVVAVLHAGAAVAENIVFPADAGVVNVKTQYGAKGDGVSDDTAALQKAVVENKGKNRTLYFPNGTYLLSGSVGIFGGKAHSADRFLTYQGQSEAGVVLKLKDRCPGFTDAAKPKIVLSIYEGDGTGDVMQSYVRNLTVDVGQGNPGAVGLRFMSNNVGAMDRVTIRSSDPNGAGKIGLDMRQGQNGPCFIKRVTVIGFDHGVETGNSFSMVFEHLTLKQQNVLGFFNVTARVTIRDLKSVNRVPAIRNKWDNMTLIEADMTGGSPENSAILNESNRVFVRDVKQSGYGHMLKDTAGKFHDGVTLDEWYEGKGLSLFGAEPKTLRLPIEETPDVPWETDLSKWVKADPEGDSEELQQAIDDAAKQGKTTLYFPPGPSYHLTEPVRVHGSINRILGIRSSVGLVDSYGKFKAGEPVFTFENLTHDTLVVEGFWDLGGSRCRDAAMFANKSGKTIVLKDMGMGCRIKNAGSGGRWFIEDISIDDLRIGPGETCWARQYNPEGGKTMIEVDGGQLWLLGLKTEGRATHVVAKNGARVEVLGGVSYQSWGNQPIDPPMFQVIDSTASFTIGFYAWNQPFTTVVEETLKGQTRTLPLKDVPGYHLPVYRSGGGGQ